MDIEKRVRELRELYPEVETKEATNGTTLVRIRGLRTDSGCTPGTTDFLLVLSASQETPVQRCVKHPITLPSGRVPNYSSALVDGETWYTYSFNFQWSPSDPMYVFVESAMSRFAQAS